MMGITGLGLNFLGSLILAVNAITGNASVFRIGSITDRLRSRITAIVGLVVLTIGFGLQFFGNWLL